MPGVLTIEAIAQCGAVAVLAAEANRGKIPFFAGIDGCRFKRVVGPGDVLDLECEFVRVRGAIAKGQGRATVEGEVAAEAMLTVFVGSEEGAE
jgi:3-hydroxyacyl-[acyl-carrier-protein] dehydratase